MRPQHVHFWFTASGYQSLITQLFWRDDPYIGHDAVFADQDSLMVDFVRQEPGLAPDGTSVDEPFVALDWTFTTDRRIAKGGRRCRGYRSSTSNNNPNRSASSWSAVAR